MSYISQTVQEVILRALSDEQATMLYVSIAFAFGSPPDVGPIRANQHVVVRGSTTQGGAPVDYGQQATVNPVNFMVYSEDALECGNHSNL